MSADHSPVRQGFGWRLLVVDADREFVDRVSRNAQRLEREIAGVWVARTGAEAIALTRTIRPDVILIDLDLPDADGQETLATLLMERPCDAVVVTRRMELDDIARAIACGASGYVIKPVIPRGGAPRSHGCVVRPADYVYDLVAPTPPDPQEGDCAQGQ